VTFKRNYAWYGGAVNMLLEKIQVTTFSENSTVAFIENCTEYDGGAI